MWNSFFCDVIFMKDLFSIPYLVLGSCVVIQWHVFSIIFFWSLIGYFTNINFSLVIIFCIIEIFSILSILLNYMPYLRYSCMISFFVTVVMNLSVQMSDVFINFYCLWCLGVTLSCFYLFVVVDPFTLQILPTPLSGGLTRLLCSGYPSIYRKINVRRHKFKVETFHRYLTLIVLTILITYWGWGGDPYNSCGYLIKV